MLVDHTRYHGNSVLPCPAYFVSSIFVPTYFEGERGVANLTLSGRMVRVFALQLVLPTVNGNVVQWRKRPPDTCVTRYTCTNISFGPTCSCTMSRDAGIS
jgi:hypothetical protein